MSHTGYMGLILVVAAITYGTRIAGFLVGQRQLPAWLDRFLTYVPVAVFAALLTPDLNIGATGTWPRLIGAVIATVVVLRFKQLWAGLVFGMAGFWLANALLTR